VGAVEAKPQGHTLGGVEPQVQQYAAGLPGGLDAPVRPLPFLYLSTGTDTRFVNLLDPEPRTRKLVQNHLHRPETLAEWLAEKPLPEWATSAGPSPPGAAGPPFRPSSLRARLRALPPIHIPGMWRNKVEAITKLEQSLYQDQPRALIQMATGSGKTLLAIASILILAATIQLPVGGRSGATLWIVVAAGLAGTGLGVFATRIVRGTGRTIWMRLLAPLAIGTLAVWIVIVVRLLHGSGPP
jgi:hypothetical protein